MICPKCGSETYTTDGVYIPKDSMIYRSRKCRYCKYSFFTAEIEVECNDVLRDAFYKYPSCTGYAKRRLPNNAVKVRCIDTGEIYETVSDAARSIKINRATITLCCQGKRKTAGGKKWEYYK